MKRLATAIVLVTGVVAVAVVAIASGFSRADCSLSRFDTKAWVRDSSTRRPAEGGPSPRQRIADTLIECEGSLQGTTRGEARRLLGRPNSWDTYDPGNAGTWSYTLGTERGFIEIDDEHLLVRFTPDRRVRSLELVTD